MRSQFIQFDNNLPKSAKGLLTSGFSPSADFLFGSLKMAKKRCSKCKQIKPVSEFYTDTRHKDGLQSRCKECMNKDENSKMARKHYQKSLKGKLAQKRYRQSEKGKIAERKYSRNYKSDYPNKNKASHAVNNAVKACKLPRPDTLQCYYCPKPAQQYHHWHGYEKEHWLDVVPVCTECHQKCKRKIA